MIVMSRKIGGTLAVVIPKAVARELGLTDKTPLEITNTNDAIIMRRQGRAPRRALSSIVAQISPAGYRRRRRELASNVAVGKEVW